MTEAGNDEKKIIIDEDWKSQVESEKVAEAEKPAPDPVDAMGALPPANFATLVSMLATQAMMSLGALANPMTGKAQVNLPQAKHSIEMIEMLQKKTEGNCDAEEASMLETLLHELRMAFVSMQAAPGEAISSEEAAAPTIELP